MKLVIFSERAYLSFSKKNRNEGHFSLYAKKVAVNLSCALRISMEILSNSASEIICQTFNKNACFCARNIVGRVFGKENECKRKALPHSYQFGLLKLSKKNGNKGHFSLCAKEVAVNHFFRRTSDMPFWVRSFQVPSLYRSKNSQRSETCTCVKVSCFRAKK